MAIKARRYSPPIDMSPRYFSKTATIRQTGSNVPQTVANIVTAAVITVASLINRTGTTDGSSNLLNAPRYWEYRRSLTTNGDLPFDASLLRLAPDTMQLAGTEIEKLQTTMSGYTNTLEWYVSNLEVGSNILTSVNEEVVTDDYSPSPQREALMWIGEATGLTKKRIADLLGVTRQTLSAWEKDKPIADTHRQALFTVYELLQRAAIRYPSPSAMAGWLDTPRDEEGRTPAELIRTQNFSQARYFAVSTPVERRTPAWVTRGVPHRFQENAEQPQLAFPLVSNDDNDTAGSDANNSA